MPDRRPPAPPRRPPVRRAPPAGSYGRPTPPPPGGAPGVPRRPTATVINVVLLIFSVVLGVGIWFLSETLHDLAEDTWNMPLLIGTLFFILAILVTLVIFAFSAITGTLEDNVFNAKPGQMPALLFTVIMCVGVFVLGALFQWLYSLDFVPGASKPTSFVFVMDDSGTMNNNGATDGTGNDPDGLRYDAIEDVLDGQSKSFRYMVYSFNSNVSVVRDMAEKGASRRIKQPPVGGQTVIKGALERVIDDYEDGEWDGGTRPLVILLTDGYPTDMEYTTDADSILERYNDAGISVSTVGLGKDLNQSLLEHIAGMTGGTYVQIDRASELSAALRTASIQVSRRDLLSTRTTYRLPGLYAVLRILFVSVLCFMIGVCATVACGQSRSIRMSIIFSAVTAVLGAVILEVGMLMNDAGWIHMDDSAARLLLWVLTSATLSTKSAFRGPSRPSNQTVSSSHF